MYQDRSTKRPKSGPCRDRDDARRSEYKRRADELKNELRNQRIAMRKNGGRRGFVAGPKASSTMLTPDYCLKPCTKPKPTIRPQSRSKSRPRMRAYETSESEPVPKPKTKKKPVSSILEDCEMSTPKRPATSSAPSTSSRMFSPKRPQKPRKKKDLDVLRSEEVEDQDYRDFLDDDCLPTQDEYKQPDKSLRRLEELVGEIEKTERRIMNIESRIPKKYREDPCEEPNSERKKVPVVCAEKEKVRTPLENSNVPDDVVIKTAENLLQRMVRPFVSDVVHRMFKTCLEWALCKHPTDDPSRLNRIINALLHFKDDVERYNAIASTTERVIIKPGEIDPESITVINVKWQKDKKRSDYTLGENQDLDYCDSSPSESLISDINTSLSESELAWLNCLEDSRSENDFDFEIPSKKEKDFFFPETRLVNAVPNRQNPNVAELDMENVLVIRNPERYLEPEYSK